MKVERNMSRINVDQVSQRAEQVTKDLPPAIRGFDKEKSWKNILSKMDKKALTWTLAMAASLSMVIASGFVNWDYEFNPQELQNQEEATVMEERTNTEISDIKGRNQVLNSRVKPVSNIDIAGVEVTEFIPVVNNDFQVLDEAVHFENKTSFTSPIRPFASMGFQQGFAPEFGLNVSVWQKESNDHIKRIDVGFSTQFAYISTESETTQIQPFAFFNVSYENVKPDNTGWMTKASVLLNPDGNHYEDHALRLTFQKSLTKHLRLGPELIFVDSFRQVYPGISLTLI